jgi:hypothetical protein
LLGRVIKVVAVDAVLVAAIIYVIQDLQWRSTYAAETINRCGGPCSYTPSFSYGLLTQVFTMSGNSVQLPSPATLDWIQVLVYALVLLNAWLVYTYWKSRRALPSAAP